ncbi:MAG: TadE/TadG family type IV pilus assembly protein [Candidatus Binataceae bacterium]
MNRQLNISRNRRMAGARGLAPTGMAGRRGQAAVELALAVPLLLLFAFSIIEFGNMLNDVQEAIDLTRQGASMASRGESVANSATAVVTGSAPLNLSQDGEVIVTEITDSSGGSPKISDQATSGGKTFTSKVGTGVGATANVPTSIQSVLSASAGTTVYTTEVYFDYTPVTPIGSLFKWSQTMPKTIYEIAYF